MVEVEIAVHSSISSKAVTEKEDLETKLKEARCILRTPRLYTIYKDRMIQLKQKDDQINEQKELHEVA